MQMFQVVSLFSLLLVCLGGLSFYFWRRSASLYSLLVEGATRYEDVRRRAQAMESQMKDHELKVRDFQQKATASEKGAQQARLKVQELLSQLEEKKTEILYVTDKLERQKSYLEALVEKQKDQIGHLESHQGLLKTQSEEKTAQLEKELAEAHKELRREKETSLREKELLTERLRASEGLQKEFAKKAQDGDPLEIKRLKRKTAQYARLFVTMKGLKEMAEERAHNWEVGLLKFATWIVQHKQGPQATLPRELGPLVGLALKMIGQELVHDDEEHGERHEQSFATSHAAHKSSKPMGSPPAHVERPAPPENALGSVPADV